MGGSGVMEVIGEVNYVFVFPGRVTNVWTMLASILSVYERNEPGFLSLLFPNGQWALVGLMLYVEKLSSPLCSYLVLSKFEYTHLIYLFLYEKTFNATSRAVHRFESRPVANYASLNSSGNEVRSNTNVNCNTSYGSGGQAGR